MKRYIGKYLVLLGGLLALAPMSGCKLDDPVIPTEELYLRNFIKQYGLIDPTQDFSSAKQVNVTLNLPDEAKVVNIYAQVGDEYYRVGCYAELSGTVTLPVDVSKATETVMVDVDGVRYFTVPNGTVDVKSGASAARSRALPGENDNAGLTAMWIDNWDSATLTNGETGKPYVGGKRNKITISAEGNMTGDLIDGKYIDVRTTAHIGKNKENETITDYTRAGEMDLSGTSNKFSGQWCYDYSEIGNTHKGTNVHFRIVNNDESLSAYRFTFRTASRNDAEVRAVIIGKSTVAGTSGVDVFMDSKFLKVESNYKGTNTGTYDTSKDGEYTEWEMRTDYMPKGEYQLIIMGYNPTKNEVTQQEFCGNWGFMKIDRLKTARDMSWILACEDLGTTDDFDFNDVVFSIEAVTTNTAALNLGVAQWQVVENTNENGFVLNPVGSSGTQNNAPSRADTYNENRTRVKVKALAAGGTLPIWLHFREEDNSVSGGTDYIVSPGSTRGGLRGALVKTSDIATTEMSNEAKSSTLKDGCNEWHRWFNQEDSKNMMNTGTRMHQKGDSVIFTTNNVFSLENFCYIQYAMDNEDGSGYPYKSTGDPWADKVLQWQWQQENSQKVTFGFFLTVYAPTVDGSSSVLDGRETKAHIISKSLEGLPPQMFLIPDCNSLHSAGYMDKYGWKWPCERVDITKVYPNFKAWVENKDSYAGSNWFMLPNPGLVDKDHMLYPRNPKDQDEYVPFSLNGTTSDNTTEK